MSARWIFSVTLALALSAPPQAARAQDARAPAVLPVPGGNAAAIAAQAVAQSAPDAAVRPAGEQVPGAAPVVAPPALTDKLPDSGAPPAVAPATEAASPPPAAPTTVSTVVSDGGLTAPVAGPRGLGIAAPGTVPAIDAGDKPMALLAGLYRCELSRSVTIRKVAADGKSLVLNWAGRDHDFSAVEARTGALRFENMSEGMVWLVIIGKAMLLDTRKGKQLANECKH